MTALSFLVNTLAFLLLGLATTRHHEARFGRRCPPGRRLLLRAGGWICLAIAFALACTHRGFGFGLIGWVGSVMIGATTAFLCLNFVRKRGVKG